MTTALDLIESTRRHLLSGQTDELNRLTLNVDASETLLNITYTAKGIQPGVAIAIDLEEMLVWAVSGTDVTVSRGANGTTAAAHAPNAIVYVKPRFSTFRILEALNNDLRDLSSPSNGLYAVRTAILTYNPAIQGYDLGCTQTCDQVLGILEVRYDAVGPERSFPRIDKYAFLRNTNTDEFPSGSVLVLYEGAYPGRPIRVQYKSAFNLMTALTDDAVVDVGLTDTMLDIPPLGAATRLVAPRDVKRAFTEMQGEPRRAQEVPPGSSTGAMRGLLMLRQQRIMAEAARLDLQYPAQLVW